MYPSNSVLNSLQHTHFFEQFGPSCIMPASHTQRARASVMLTSCYKSLFMDIYVRQPPAISGILWFVQLPRYDKKLRSSSEKTSLSTTTKRLLCVTDKNFRL